MQLVTAPALNVAAPAGPTTPGTVIGHGRIRGWDDTHKQSVDFEANVVAGTVLRAGIKDIQEAASELIARGWNGEPRDYAGLVGFVRNGDVWDAVALLAPELPGGASRQLWSVGDLQGLRVAAGVQLDAIWQISDFGGDMRWGTPQSMIPAIG